MTRRHRIGFTLIEMMAIVAIIGMLAVLLLPALNAATLSAQTAQCQSRLRQCGTAYQSRALDLRMQGRHLEPVVSTPAAWASQLGDYLDGNRAVVQCPVADIFDHGTVEAQNELVTVEGLDITLGVPAGTITIPLGNTTPMAFKYPWVPQSSDNGGRPEGAFTLAFLHSSKWKHYINNPDQINNAPLVYHNPPPNMENKINIYPNRDGEGTVTIYVHKLAHYNSEGALLFNGVPVENNKGTFQVSGGKWFDAPTVLSQEGYGINNRVADMGPGANRIFLLDYGKTVAECADTETETHSDSWTVHQAPRHFDQMNALMGDGSVAIYHPDELNPNDPYIQANMWQPPNP